MNLSISGPHHGGHTTRGDCPTPRAGHGRRRSGDLVDALAGGAAVFEALHALGSLGVAQPLVPLLVQRRAVHPQVGESAGVGAQQTAAPRTQRATRPRTQAAGRALGVGLRQPSGVITTAGRQRLRRPADTKPRKANTLMGCLTLILVLRRHSKHTIQITFYVRNDIHTLPYSLQYFTLYHTLAKHYTVP